MIMSNYSYILVPEGAIQNYINTSKDWKGFNGVILENTEENIIKYGLQLN